MIAAASTARRLVITNPGKVEFVDEQLPPVGPDDVLAESVVSGISQGTELAWYRGNATALSKGWNPSLRLYQAEQPPRAHPISPGYETVAKVVAIGDQVTVLRPGALVYLDRPHADRHLVEQQEAASGLLPESTTPDQAVFYPLARVALGAVHDAAVHLGDTVAVTGLGVVGLLAARLAQQNGAQLVIGVDRYPLRLEAARRQGILTIDTGATADVAEAIRELTGGQGVDAAIEASGSYRLLHEAIRCCALAGRVAAVASYHGQEHGLRLGQEYHRNRITLISSMTVNDAPQRAYPAWDLGRLNTTARALVDTAAVPTSDLITQQFGFHDADLAYDLIDTSPEKTIKVVLTYGS
jgi:2-desacetyl-2-hydroxyethyl bacteriochlorophyllide A dehydrogenase